MSDRLTLQFSSCAPHWRNFTPPIVKKGQGLFGPISLVFDKYWATPLIRRMSHSPFTHCDMILEDGSLLGASDNPGAPVIRGNPRGVAIRPPEYQEFSYRRWMILNTDRADDIRAIACTQVGKDFDNTGLKEFVGDKFPGVRDWRLDKTWWCSELMAWAMEAGGFWQPRLLIWPKNRVSPTDLLLVCLMDERWVNRDAFWLPVPGLKLGPDEK